MIYDTIKLLFSASILSLLILQDNLISAEVKAFLNTIESEYHNCCSHMHGCYVTNMCDMFLLQVKHKYTDQVMVMKEMKRATDDAKCTFLKEVS